MMITVKIEILVDIKQDTVNKARKTTFTRQSCREKSHTLTSQLF